MAFSIIILRFLEPPRTIPLVILFFSVFTGVGSGKLGEIKNDDFYESLHDKDTRNSFGHIKDFSLSLPPQKPLLGGRKSHEERKSNKVGVHRRYHNKHHREHLDFLELHKNLLDFEQQADIEERKFNAFITDIEKVKETPYNPHHITNYKKFDVTFLKDQDSWPRFGDIELLAGVAGWKKERWKDVTAGVVTEKPKTSRTTKFMYRRVQSISGDKRNAIIAVSAISQVPQEHQNNY